MEDIKQKSLALIDRLVSGERLLDILGLAVIIGVVFVFFSILKKVAVKVLGERFTPQIRYFILKAIDYSLWIVLIMTVFNRLGINLTALMGAAGIAGIAIGFAAQTSVSNVISGLFVMTERAFKLGDILQVDGVTGVVESFDLLSVRLKTFDNQLVRIPNETVIKTNLVNLTHYETRRFNLRVSVAYGSDLERVMALLLEIAAQNQWAVSEPAPVVIVDSFAASGIDMIMGVWTRNEDFLALRNSLFIETHKRFQQEGISIPFPQMDVRVSPSGS